MPAFPRTLALIESGIARGLHPGAQLYVSRHGETLIDAALGEARPAAGANPAVAMRPDSLTLWMSACKPITAIAVAQQWEADRLDLDAPVASYIPDFAQGGKQAVTVRHVLTHTGGFRPNRFKYPGDDWDAVIAAICATPIEPDWTPGRKAGYHVHTGWFILGELVQRASGEPIADYLRRHILGPSGMDDSWVGMPAERYCAYRDRLSVMMNTAAQPPVSLGWHGERWVTGARPSGNGCGPARELARFYQMLLRGGEGPTGQRVVQPQTVELFTARHREGMFDHSFEATIDWGLGFIIDSKRHADPHARLPYGYGPHASDRAFGHSGFQSSAAFADPEHGLAVALVFNGCPGENAHQQRIHDTLGTLYEELGLTR